MAERGRHGRLYRGRGRELSAAYIDAGPFESSTSKYSSATAIEQRGAKQFAAGTK
jgi:hypothetical protein